MKWLIKPTLNDEGPTPRLCLIRNNSGNEGGSCVLDFCGDEFCIWQFS